MTKLWKNLLIGGFLLAFVVLLGFFNATKPRILVLHSSSAGSSWARQVDRGIREVLRDNRRPLSVEWHYLGVDSPASKRNIETARADALRAMSRFRPDVLVAVDDQANSLVAREYAGCKSPRVLYVSLNRPPSDYGYAGAANVTGIAERLPLAAVRDAMRDLFPERRPALAVIGVDDESGRAEMAQVDAFDWGFVQMGEKALVATADEWRDFVKRCPGDVLLVLGTHDLPGANGAVATAADINRWTHENARGLPIGMQVNFVEDGGALSFSPPPDDSGSKAMCLALDWLDDRETPGAPAPVVSEHFEVALRPALLRQRGIKLPPVYIEAARENGTLFK